jgi:hypothetical protein
VVPDITFFKLDLNIAFEVLMLRLQNNSNYHFYFEYAQRLLNVYSNLLYAHSQYSRCNFSISSLFYRIIQGEVDLLADSQIGACFSCSTNIMEASGVTLHRFKTWQELLYFIM